MQGRTIRRWATILLLATATGASAETVLCVVPDVSGALGGTGPLTDARSIHCPRDNAPDVLFRFPELPDNVRIDALSVDPSSGDWVFSVDRGFTGANGHFQPDDLIRDGSQGLALFMDVGGRLGLDGAVNVDGLSFDSGEVLVSLSLTHQLPCGLATDQDVVRINPASCTIEVDGTSAGLPEGIDLVAMELDAADEWQLALDRTAQVDGITASRQGVLGLSGSNWRVVTSNADLDDNRRIQTLAIREVEIIFANEFESDAAGRVIRLR